MMVGKCKPLNNHLSKVRIQFSTILVHTLIAVCFCLIIHYMNSIIHSYSTTLKLNRQTLKNKFEEPLYLSDKLSNATIKNQKVIIVTGSSGFIGRNLVHSLLDLNTKPFVIGIDVFEFGTYQNVQHQNFSFIKHDISKYVTKKDEKILQIDFIFHLAGLSDPEVYTRNPLRTMKVNIQGTANIIDLARLTKSELLIASSSEIYGDPLEHPQSENYWGHPNLYNERACYSQSKRYNEALACAFSSTYKFSIFTPRIFNAYGPHLTSKVIYKLIFQALRAQNLTVYGDGKQTRSFLFVDELVKGMLRLAETDYVFPINLGNHRETSIKDLAHLIARRLNAVDLIVYVTNTRNEPVRRRPDLSLTRKIIKWDDFSSLEEGLNITLNAIIDNVASQSNLKDEWHKELISE